MIDLPDRTRPQEPLARFRRKIAENARAWLGFVQAHRPESPALTREFANLAKAANQALLEPDAWADGLALVVALWPFVEWQGHWLAWRDVLNRALSVCRRLDAPAIEVNLTDQLGELARSVGESRAALAWQEQALALARGLRDQEVIGRVLVHLSQQYLPHGQYQAAQACCQEAISLLEPLDARGEVAIAHNNWGIACMEEGRMEAARSHFVLAETMFEAQGNRRGLAKAIHNLGESYLSESRWAEAEPIYHRAIAAALEAGDEVNAIRSRTSLATLSHYQGHPEKALALHREIETFYRRLGDRSMLAKVINNEGVFLLELGRPAEAGLAFEQAAQMHLAIGNLGDAAGSILNWVESLLAQDEVEHALARLRQVKDLLDALPGPPAGARDAYSTLLEQALAKQAPG